MPRAATKGAKPKQLIKTRRGSETNIIFPQTVTSMWGPAWTLERMDTVGIIRMRQSSHPSLSYSASHLREMADFFVQLADVLDRGDEASYEHD